MSDVVPTEYKLYHIRGLVVVIVYRDRAGSQMLLKFLKRKITQGYNSIVKECQRSYNISQPVVVITHN